MRKTASGQQWVQPRATAAGALIYAAAICGLTAGVGFGAPSALAQDATWLLSPSTNDFNTGANWSPTSVPTGTAFFGASNTTSLTFSENTTLGGWTFNEDAADYTFTIDRYRMGFDGEGIVANGGSVTINNSNFLQFFDNSTAGDATINNDGPISDGGKRSAFLQFFGDSTAGSATLNNISGDLGFYGNSTAANAIINNSSRAIFFANSTAGSATIINDGQLSFSDTSTASSAIITNHGELDFVLNSTGGWRRSRAMLQA